MKKSTTIIICLVAVIIVACVAFFQESEKATFSDSKDFLEDSERKNDGETDLEERVEAEDHENTAISEHEEIPNLTKDEAYELLKTAHDEYFRICSYGFSKNQIAEAYTWYCDKNNVVPRLDGTFDPEQKHSSISKFSDYRVCFIPELDTIEKFDLHFLNYFTENVLENIKHDAEIAEFDGKLVGMSGYFEGDISQWDKTVIKKINQEDSKACVTVSTVSNTINMLQQVCDENGNPSLVYLSEEEYDSYDFELVYSAEAGWRINNKLESVIYMKTVDDTYEDEQYIANLSDEVLEVVRPDGYKDLLLTENTAREIFLEVIDASSMLMNFGFSNHLSDDWASIAKNCVPSIEDVGKQDIIKLNYSDAYRVYYIPALDTMEKFDSYFLRFFTEETLERMKKRHNVSEFCGKLAVNFYDNRNSSGVVYDLTEVTSVSQEPGAKKAIASFNLYGLDGEFWKTQKFTFEYSEEYGWKIDLNIFSDV